MTLAASLAWADTPALPGFETPGYCAIVPAPVPDPSPAAEERARQLYREGEFRAVAAHAAGLAIAAQASGDLTMQLRALLLEARSLKALACDGEAIAVQQEHRRLAEAAPASVPGIALARCHSLARLARLGAARELAEAQALGERARACAVGSDADDVASEALTTLAIIAIGRSEYTAAGSLLDEALQRARSSLMRAEALRTRGALVLASGGDPIDAARVFSSSVQAARDAGDLEAEALASIYQGAAQARAVAGSSAEAASPALAPLVAGRELASAHGMRRGVALSLYEEGLLRQAVGTGAAMASADNELQAAATLYATVGDVPQEAKARLALATVRYRVGDYAQARRAALRTRDLELQAGLVREAAKADHLLGLIARWSEPPDYAQAHRHLESALAGLRDSGEDRADVARVLNDLALVESNLGQPASATARLQEALALAGLVRNDELSRVIETNLAWFWLRDGREDDALQAWLSALQSPAPATRAFAWWSLAELVLKRAPHVALARYGLAVQEVERMRPQAEPFDEATRTAFGRRYSELYRAYAALLVRMRRYDEAAQIMLLTQRRELLEAHWIGTRGGSAAGTAASPAALTPRACAGLDDRSQQEALLRRREWERQRTPARDTCCDTDGTAPACTGDAGLLAYCVLRHESLVSAAGLRERQDGCVAEIERQAQQRTAERQGTGTSDADAADDPRFAVGEPFRSDWTRAVGRSEVYLIVTLVEDDRLWVWLRRPGQGDFVVREQAITRAALHERTVAVRQGIDVARDTAARRPPLPETERRAALAREARSLREGPLHELYTWLVGTFGPDALPPPTSTGAVIAFVLDRALRDVPMAALFDGERYLGERHAIALLTSASLVAFPTEEPARDSLVMGISRPEPPTAQFDELPNVEHEVAEVATALGVQPLLNARSTKSQLLLWLRSRDERSPGLALHIASHGAMGGTADSSFVYLQADTPGKADELNGRELLGEARDLAYLRLLVLSACDTARGGDDGPALGLAGIASAGARSVVGSLWQVNDASTAQLMGMFYREWRRDRHVGVARALALAQRQLLARTDFPYEHPYFWAGFEVIGRWD